MENTTIVSPQTPMLLPAGTQESLPKASVLFGNSFLYYKKNFKNIVSIGLVPFGLNAISVAISGVSPEASVLFTFLSFVAGMFALLAFFDFVRSGGNMEGGVYGVYMRSTKMFFPYAWVLLFQNLAVVGGFFVFVVPGIIFSILLGQSSYAFFLENKKGVDALILSWHYVAGNWWSVLWRLVFLGVLLFLVGFAVYAVIGFGASGGVITQYQSLSESGMPANPEELAAKLTAGSRLAQIVSDFLINMFSMPFGVIYGFLLYQGLQGLKSGVVLSQEETMRKKKIIKIFFTIAIVGIIILVFTAGSFLSWFIQYLMDPNADIPGGDNFFKQMPQMSFMRAHLASFLHSLR